MLQMEKAKTEFRKAVDEHDRLVARGEYGRAAQAAGRAGRVARRLRQMTEGSPDWAHDVRRWQRQQDWARQMARKEAQ